jgi:hypothetical protein
MARPGAIGIDNPTPDGGSEFIMLRRVRTLRRLDKVRPVPLVDFRTFEVALPGG